MAASDVVITTALVPGRTAPVLVTTQMVDAMPPGAVIVDLAAEAGGNCEATVPGEDVMRGSVTIIGQRNPAAAMPMHASQLYARNVGSLLALVIADGAVALDPDDPVIAGACLTRGGEVVHPAVSAIARGGQLVTQQLIYELTIFALAVFVGFEVISKVPTMLHTPLMSGTNAIHGIVLIGALLVLEGDDLYTTILGMVAIAFGAINIVGGFLVTDRMLQMFRRRED